VTEVDIAADADRCYALLCDIERTPEWVPTVTGVRVLARDDDGRISEAWFIGGAGSAAYAYRLRYAHDPAARRLRWWIEDTTLRDLDGEAEIVDLGGGRCRLRYQLHASTLSLAGGRVSLRDELPEPIAESFRSWVEKLGV